VAPVTWWDLAAARALVHAEQAEAEGRDAARWREEARACLDDGGV